MPKSDEIRIRHALDAARKAISFTEGMGRDDLARDDKTLLATLHAIMVVGEALGQVSTPTRRRHPEIPWRDVVGTRNRLVHAYDDVDHTIVWQTAREDLPRLVDQLERILSGATDTP